jgi:hypothetical protein
MRLEAHNVLHFVSTACMLQFCSANQVVELRLLCLNCWQVACSCILCWPNSIVCLMTPEDLDARKPAGVLLAPASTRLFEVLQPLPPKVGACMYIHVCMQPYGCLQDFVNDWPSVSVVYCIMRCTGSAKGSWDDGRWDLEMMLISASYEFCSAC